MCTKILDPHAIHACATFVGDYFLERTVQVHSLQDGFQVSHLVRRSLVMCFLVLSSDPSPPLSALTRFRLVCSSGIPQGEFRGFHMIVLVAFGITSISFGPSCRPFRQYYGLC